MKKKTVFILSIFAAFACVFSACNNVSKSTDKKLTPHYLLTGTFDSSATASADDIFDYYDIGNDEYAVSLKDSIKFTHNSAITIPSVHPVYTTKKVTGIWHDAFYKNPATSISFAAPSNIETIDYEAFLYSNITNITIPYTVNQIGDGAFYACSNLTKVTFVNSNQESTGTATNCECTDCVDEGGDSGDTVTPIYSTLTKIPSLCFFKCNNLLELSLPSSIVEICEEAFNGCSELKSDLFFQNIEIIRSRAFQGCTSLSNVYISKSLFANANNIGIEPHAFNYCDPSLTFKFCGTQANVEAWVNNHLRWGWRVDRGNPATTGNSYGYDLTTGDNYFTADWTYTVDAYNNVTITKFNGKASDITNGFISIPDHMPTPVGNKVVYISREAFTDDVKLKLKRIYLPTTLMSVANWMFNSKYDNLYVIDDNTACATDFPLGDSAPGRIDLSGLKDLEFIGIRAFAGIGNKGNPKPKLKIKTLHLPAKIKAIGGEAFGIFGFRMLSEVTEFIWDYDDTNSCLETVGTDAFYGLGITDPNNASSVEIMGNVTHKKHKASTIIFPRTFKYFGMLSSDINRYKSQATNKFWFDETTPSGYGKPNKEQRPAHAFAGCSLIGKAVFKGSNDSNKTSDLIIPVQTFVFNESLHTIIFEERNGKTITFHTQQGGSKNTGWDYAQEAIGGNAGRGKNDFRGEPFLQTLVLPNQTTNIRVQDFAFHANSRGVIYLSGAYGSRMYSDNKDGHWKDLQFENQPLASYSQQWKTIGNETFYQSGNRQQYHGYCFAPKATVNSSNPNLNTYDASINTFSINQEMPVYDNVYFVDEETGATVGSKTNARRVVMKDKCAFVCEKDSSNNYVATMSKYLYNLYDHSTGDQLSGSQITTAIIPETVTAKDENDVTQTYTVTKIGDSAFSACFCDGQDTDPIKPVGSFDDLSTVVMPDTITDIGEYAFIRSYGIKTIKAYTGNATPEERVSSSLKHIGKNAFLFTDIRKVLKIPYDCLFYETENNTHDITSIFANDTGLRQISFLNEAKTNEVYTSKYYEVTTYTSTGGDTCACALYSRPCTGQDYSGETLYNKDRLLLVLNRDYADNKQPSTDCTVNSANDGLRFNGQYKNNEFLFGAFKMGYWIKELVFGSATTNGSGTKLTQPLFSAIGSRSSSTDTLMYKIFYLGCNGDNTTQTNAFGNGTATMYGNDILYENSICDLTTIAGEVFNLPNYAMNGVDYLTKTELNYKQNGILPEGVFANVTSRDTQYITAGAEGNVAHVLDLRTTGYIEISKDTFKNNSSIDKFIAPDVTNFTIGESAFDSCANLATLDLSAVTGSLTINARAFANTPITSITWPSSSCTVTINDGGTVGGAFEDCTSLTSVSLPLGLTKLGDGAFKGCTSLVTVTISSTIGITSIGDYAFYNCDDLDTFDFSKLTALETIGAGAFQNTGEINNSGNIVLPDTLTSVGASAFSGSGIVSIVFESNDSIALGESAFASCTSLETVRFSDPDCDWEEYNLSVFNGCTSLEELQLPSTFNANNQIYESATDFFIQNDNSIEIFYYKEFDGSPVSTGWRYTGTGSAKVVHYFVSNVQNLLDTNVIDPLANNGVNNGNTQFWTVDANGHAINLGNVVSYDGTTVTFSNGSTLTGTSFTHP